VNILRFLNEKVLLSDVFLADGSRNPAIDDAFHQKMDFYYKNIRNRLPSDFVTVFEAEDGFHDFVIKEIKITRDRNKKIKLILFIKLGKRDYILQYYNVNKYSICFTKDGLKNGSCIGIWNIDEFDVSEDYIIQEIQMVFGETMIIEFEQASVIRKR
jgi:hypothetical protein